MSELVISELYFRKIINEFIKKQKNITGTLYHYTSLSSFNEIIKNKTLRCTEANYLNDTEEGKYIFKLLKKAVKKVFKNQTGGELLDSINEIIKKEDLSTYGMFYEPRIDKNGADIDFGYCFPSGKVFLSCFSSDGDSLPMWYYYANKTGVNIGIEADKIVEQYPFEKSNLKIIKIEYEEKKQICLLQEILQKLLYEYKNNYKNRETAFYAFMCALSSYRYQFKNPCFSYEKEIRIVICIPEEYMSELNVRFTKDRTLHCYYDLPIELKKSKITCSPLLNFRKEKNKIKEFLNKNGIEEGIIKSSKCPIRF